MGTSRGSAALQHNSSIVYTSISTEMIVYRLHVHGRLYDGMWRFTSALLGQIHGVDRALSTQSDALLLSNYYSIDA